MANDLFSCERCNGTDNVAMVYINDIPRTYCNKCRSEMFERKNPVGRPKEGITKKVSLTLPPDVWQLIDSRKKELGCSQSKTIGEMIFKFFETKGTGDHK